MPDELGLVHLFSSEHRRDILLLYASRFFRLAAFGGASTILVLHLRLLGFADTLVGLFLSLTLLGDVLLSLVITWIADQAGRRVVLVIGSVLMAISGAVFATSSSYAVLLLAAIFGVVSPSGNEVGPFAAVETGMLSQLCAPSERVHVLMWYGVLGWLGVSLGNLVSGISITYLEEAGWDTISAYRVTFAGYAVLAIVKAILSIAMSKSTELGAPKVHPKPVPVTTAAGEREPLLPASEAPAAPSEAVEEPAKPPPLPMKRLIFLCVLFSLDSFGSSLITMSFISYYLRTTFDASIKVLSRTFSAGSLISCISGLLAGSISKRIGIIGTMVGTHMPAQLLTISIGLSPTLPLALTAFLLRATIATMDSAVRSAFLAAIVPPESRTRFLGIVNVCKTFASAGGPTLSGGLASRGLLRFSFVLTGCIKLVYDVCLWISFSTTKLEH